MVDSARALRMAVFSYAAWGFFPVYWHLLKRIPAPEILSHRLIWSSAFYAVLFAVAYRGRSLKLLLQQRRGQWAAATLCAFLLAINWGVYIYAVNSGNVLQGSMAYFINPLLNIVVGVLLFKEPFPRPLQFAFTSALVGVLAQAFFSSVFPSIALILASTFCLYGVVKKKLKVSPDLSSMMEGMTGLLPAVAAAWILADQRSFALTPTELALLIGGGVVTGWPLYLFSYAAQRLRYSLLGMLQFIAPTLQFLVGVIIFKEKLDIGMTVAFGFIWLGVAVYLAYQARSRSKKSRLNPAG